MPNSHQEFNLVSLRLVSVGFMGLQDFIFGRTDKQRAKRAEKIRKRFGTDPSLSPPMLEALTRANTVPEESQLELYRLAVPDGAEPTRASFGFLLKEGRDEVAVLFPDGLSILSRDAGKQKNGERFPLAGAQVPFWGIQSVEMHTLQNDDAALVVTGSDGSRPYQLAYVNSDSEEVASFAEDLEAARRADAQRRAGAQGPAGRPSVTGQPSVTIDSSLPPEEQLEALRQMREMTGMPDDAYEALVRKVNEGLTESE